MTQQNLLNKADEYKKLIQSYRLNRIEQQIELENYFKTALTFSSNALEGSTLTISETKLYLEEGITDSKKPLKEYDEAAGHAQAYDEMISLTRKEQFDITVDTIKRLHYLLYHRINEEEAGQYRTTQAYVTATKHLPPEAEEIPHLMEHFISQMQTSKKLMHPIEYAAICHKRIIDMQPFAGGNGQLARLIMNLVLVNSGYTITPISPELRSDYIDALVVSQKQGNPEIDTFINLIINCVIESEKDYCKILGIM